MNKTIGFIITFCFWFHSHAQFNISKAHVFSKNNFAGNVRVDENGNQITPGVTTSIIIYVRTKGNDVPSFSTAIIGNEKFTLTATTINDCKVLVGKNEDDGNPISLCISKREKVLKLELSPNLIQNQKGLSDSLAIALQGSFKNKIITYIITQKPVRLYAISSP